MKQSQNSKWLGICMMVILVFGLVMGGAADVVVGEGE
jgi:hypothetical protein